MTPKLILFYFLFLSNFIFSQNIEYSVSKISDSLKLNANAVVRFSNIDLNIETQRKMIIKSIEAITVLNDLGLKNLDLSEVFDKNRKILKIEVKVFDAFGKEIKKFKKGDFKDVSVSDGFSVFNDNRMLYLDFTPTAYPFTIEIIKEVETSNTAFVPSWSPINGYYVSTEISMLNIKYNSDLKLNYKELNFSKKYLIKKKNGSNEIKYIAENILAKKNEELAPSFINISPVVIFGLDKFNLEGVDGSATTWEEMGKWFFDEILIGTSELPKETVAKVIKLVENEKDNIIKAEIIYKYVQEKTRYVSIQEGIGGWKPMLAKDVDRLGYGDCKALTNYTRALLDAVGISSYYCRLYGQNNKREIYTDLVSFQSNHVILAIPNDNEYIWLECTSQTQPFGFQGGFTDDRNAFVIKPGGSEIVKTKKFLNKDNSKLIKGTYTIDNEGGLLAKIKIVYKGINYDDNFGKERLSLEEQVKIYKENFSTINNLKIDKINFINDKDKIQFTEELELKANSYASSTNGKLMFTLNAFNQNRSIPKKYKDRENPFEVARGSFSEEEIQINLPDDYLIEAIPNSFTISSKYGEYKTEVIKSKDHSIIFKREFLLKEGYYEKEDYEEFRLFLEKVAKNDNARAILIKKT